MMKGKAVISILCVFVTIASMIIIYEYPVGDWVSSPLIINFILIPFLYVEIVAMISFLTGIRPGLSLALQVILAILSLWLTIDYVITH